MGAEGPDNSSNLGFINSANRLLAGTRRSPTVRIEAEFYEAGAQTAHFNTAGLVWPLKDAWRGAMSWRRSRRAPHAAGSV